jgi:L-alanine-DL-glutamate epimerase-like enolase superfamily enzyme
VVVVELHDGGAVGRGECVPYPRYGESVDSVRAAVEAAGARLDAGRAHAQIQAMPAGAARNALDCAAWDLQAKQAGRPVWALAGLPASPQAIGTMRTVSVGSPAQMRKAAAALGSAEVIKVKVDGGDDLERIAAVHEAAPGSKLVVDANEAWSSGQTAKWLPELPELGVAVLEQPLPADDDAALDEMEHAVPICADESFHDRSSFSKIDSRYDMINIKLDKTGGLTEALACQAEAVRLGLPVMVGCMVSTSLAIEPALLLAAGARYVDLDGPLLLETDRKGALHDVEAGLLRPSPSIWGGA